MIDRLFILSLMIALAAGCGKSNQQKLQEGLDRQTIEDIEMYNAYADLAEEIATEFESITDDASAESAIPRLRELGRKQRIDQEEWFEPMRAVSLEHADEYDQAQARFYAARDRVLAERNRLMNAASRDSPMYQALTAYVQG